MVPVNRDPYRNALFRLLGVFAQLEAEMAQRRMRDGIAPRHKNESYHHGPAPLCFEKDDGRPIEADNYHRVVILLDWIGKGTSLNGKCSGAWDVSCDNRSVARSG